MTTTVRKPQRTPIWRNVTFLKWAAQLIALGAALALLYVLFTTAAQNIQNRGITFGWDWLDDPPGVSIREGIDTNPSSGSRALLVGIVNMLRVTVSGIIAATIIGTLVGVSRLSTNWIVSKVATVYIETIRNIPLLVQIFFWLAVIQVMPTLDEPALGERWFVASSKGIGVPWLFPGDGFWQWSVFLIAGAIAGYYVHRWRLRLMEETGKEAYANTWAFGTLLLFAVVGWFAHPIVGWLTYVWAALASFFGGVPIIIGQLVLAGLALFAAFWWIKGFLDARRTPSGLGNLTDDDWFRLIFTGIVGVAGAAFFMLFPTVTDWILSLFVTFFEWLESKFGIGRTGAPLTFGRPAVERTGNFINYGTSGMIITPGFFAVWVGVTLYTGAFIAEIVRGGILAVPKGQTEAGSALGLRRGQLLRLIILPQAFRIILPPLGNQYLNLAKNTSLGIAVAFPEIVQVGQTIYNQTGQSLPVVLTWMGFFLTVSLTISAVVNYFNRKLQLVER